MEPERDGSLAAINLVLAILGEGGPISELIDTATKEGRLISGAEFNKLFARDDDARAQLVAALDVAKAEGR